MQPLESTNVTAIIDVTLPPHAASGDVFDFLVGTQRIRVKCPKQFPEGDMVRIKAPAFLMSPASQHETKTLEIPMFIHPIHKQIGYIVTIPPNVEHGDTFLVKLDGHHECCVRCPHTHRPGMSLEFVPPRITREPRGKDAVNE
jgi:hypothetical protein